MYACVESPLQEGKGRGFHYTVVRTALPVPQMLGVRQHPPEGSRHPLRRGSADVACRCVQTCSCQLLRRRLSTAINCNSPQAPSALPAPGPAVFVQADDAGSGGQRVGAPGGSQQLLQAQARKGGVG